MKIFEPVMLKFEEGNWASDPELGLLDTILEHNPKLIKMLEQDITKGQEYSTMGRQDSPSVEQVVQAALYKEMYILIIVNLNMHRKIQRYVSNL